MLASLQNSYSSCVLHFNRDLGGLQGQNKMESVSLVQNFSELSPN